jgi:hypothetical protein
MVPEIPLVLGEVLLAINVMALPYLTVIWVAFALVTWAGSVRSRTHARAVVDASPGRAPAVSALSWPARAAAFRTAILLASTLAVFVVTSAASNTDTPAFLGAAMFAVAMAALCAFDVFTVIALLRFGDLISDVLARRTLAGRDAAIGYATVIGAFGALAIAYGLGLSL